MQRNKSIQKLKKLGFEFKFSDQPKLTKSMHQTYEQLELDNLYVIHPGEKNFPLSENIRAIGIIEYLNQ
ncbi:MAG: hypothetical protein JXR42_04370 [Gammaproteobacteria bacterium]|nr:hypothetical protein [Gammaproteobacteria bacterium]